jgi:cell wall-associated NlpC family hydrolase
VPVRSALSDARSRSVIRKLAVGAVLVLATPVAVASLAVGPRETSGPPTPLAQSEIPVHLLPVYRSAAATCGRLPWQVLAAIGWQESRHGQGRVDPVTGDVDPPIEGPPLDGRSDFALLRDQSGSDGYARALGPMQFLRSAWDRWATLAPDRPPGASPDVQNAWDAIFTAARYLCAGRDEVGDVHDAVLSYNRSDAYVRAVLDKARSYGMGGSVETTQLVNGSGDRVVAGAMTQLGVPYVWGGAAPTSGFDCSGLVQWAYAQIGVALPRTTKEQILVGSAAAVADLRPGDLVFSRSLRDGRLIDLGHVAIYAGGGQVIVAPRTGEVVSMRPLRAESVQAVRRVLR